MIPILSRDQMRRFDAHASAGCGVSSRLLMENAGRGVVDVIDRKLGSFRTRGARVLVVCGTGNNGGDGFVVARHLMVRGAVVRASLLGDTSRLTGDARANHDSFIGIGGAVTPVDQNFAVGEVDLLIDALFGTGLDRELGGLAASVVSTMNASGARCIAVDVPSGINADTGAVMGTAVRAEATVTFGHAKMGFFTAPGALHTGVVHVADIGVPPSSAAHIGQVAGATERSDIASWIRPRGLDAHKHSVGQVAILGGSAGKVGAALLSAHGALRAGAGAATIATWPSAVDALNARVVEVMTAPITTDRAVIDAILKGKHVVVMGPGFGLHDDARCVVEHVLSSFSGPIVLDADGLTLLAQKIEMAASAKASLVLTPHAGELARLLGTTAAAIEADRLTAARAAAQKTRATVLLKGRYTLIAHPDGRVAVNCTGNPALATAGSGDVLSGILGAFAHMLAPFEAACAAAYVHGASADAWSVVNGDRGILASEIADGVPAVLKALASDHGAMPV